MNAEQFIFKVIIQGDKNDKGFPGWRTLIERTVEVNATSPEKIGDAIALLTKVAVDEITDVIIDREMKAALEKAAEEANKEPEEVTE